MQPFTRGDKFPVSSLFRTLALCGLLTLSGTADATFRPAPAPLLVHVGAFSGSDSALAQAVSETLLTDLAKSNRLALMDARTGSGRSASPAAYMLTGSCLLYGDNVIINVRLLNRATGQTVPGGAENVSGPRSDVFQLTHDLASRLTIRLTTLKTPASSSVQSANKPGAGSLSRPLPGSSRPAMRSATLPPMSRLKTLTPAVPKVIVPLDPPRVEKVDRGEEETRNVEKPDVQPEVTTEEREPDIPANDRVERGRGYTSIIIDARGFGLDRSMSPRIRREDGSVVWAGENASPDFAIETGIVGYARTLRDARNLARAGKNPLILEAVGRYGAHFPSDPILTDEDSDFLLRAGRRDGFLRRFNVIFVLDR